MKCTICGAELESRISDLPFKTSEQSIVVLKGLPVLQCGNCPHYLIDDTVLARVDEILTTRSEATELEVIRYAA
jgi:YgiT-type zinc finger domain-containing protein